MSDKEFRHPIFHEDADQLTMWTAVLDAFPGQQGNPNVVVPIHPQVRQAWAKEIIARGGVIVPALMTKLPVSTGAHPEAGWLQPMDWVKREEYDAQCAAQAEAAASTSDAERQAAMAQQETQMKDALRATKPSLLHQIESLTDPEARAAMAARLKPQAIAAIDAVQAALDQVDRTQEKEGTDG